MQTLKQTLNKKLFIGILAVISLVVFGIVMSIPPARHSLAATIPTPVASFQTSLSTGISASDTSMTLVSLTTIDGTTLVNGQTYGFTIDEGTASQEFVIGTANTSNNTITGLTRGVSGVTGLTNIAALQKTHRRGASVKITDAPVILVLARILNGDETVPNRLRYATSSIAFSNDADIITKKYADDLAISGSPAASTSAPGISSKASTAQINADTGSSGGYELFVGPDALAASKYGLQLPSADQKAALAGTAGTPSTSNRYVTNDDTTATSTPGLLVRANGSGKIDIDFIDQNSLGLSASSTADLDINDNDALYPTGNDIASRYAPTGFITNASTTGPSTNVNNFVFRIDNDRVISFTGGDQSTASDLHAQVGTIASSETSITWGSEADLMDSSATSLYFDVAQVSSSRYVVIWQETGNDIKARIVDVSGTTITPRTSVTLGTWGLSADVSVVTLDATRVLVQYTDNSPTDKFVEVVSISGSSLVSNTRVLLDADGGNSSRSDLVLLDTDKVLAVYSNTTGTTVESKIVTISSTTPTVNASTQLEAALVYRSIKLTKIDTGRALLSYVDSSENERAVVLSVSGTTITEGTSISLAVSGTTGNEAYIDAYQISETIALVGFAGTSANAQFLVQIDGTTLSSVASYTALPAPATDPGIGFAKIRPFKYVVLTAGSGARIITLNQPTGKFFGVAKADIADGASGEVSYRYGMHTGMSGLTAGTIYYIDDNGTASTNTSSVSQEFGVAINSTTILLK